MTDALPSAAIATASGLSRRAASKMLSRGAQGQLWRGHSVPVVRLPGGRGGVSGEVLALDRSHATPELLTLLKLDTVSLPATAGPAPVPNIARWQFEEQQDRLRIIKPILDTPPRSRARAAAYRSAAETVHSYRGRPKGEAKTGEVIENLVGALIADAERAHAAVKLLRPMVEGATIIDRDGKEGARAQ